MRRLVITASLVAILSSWALPARAGCSADTAALRAAKGILLNAPLEGTSLTATATDASHRFRAAVLKTIERTVVASGSRDPNSLRGELTACLASSGVSARARFPGALVSIDVQEPIRGTVVVKPTFAIPCGSDSALLVFSTAPGEHHLVVRVDSGLYRRIDRAFGALDYLVVDERTVVFAAVGPWCDTDWQELRLRVVRSSADGQSEILDVDDTIYTGFDEPPVKLERTSEGFEVRYATVADFGGEPEVVFKTVTYSAGRALTQTGESIEREGESGGF